MALKAPAYYDEEVRKEASARLSESGGGDVGMALEHAKEAVEERRRRLAAIAAASARVKLRATALGARTDDELYGRAKKDPFVLLGLRDPEKNPWARKRNMPGPASGPQCGWLKHAGVPVPANLTKLQASVLIGELKSRAAAGKADVAQLWQLAKMGMKPGRRLTGAAAAKLIQAVNPEPGFQG